MQAFQTGKLVDRDMRMRQQENPGLGRVKRPTQLDVARLAGVSQAMVSYVVNGSPSVSLSDETRQRVLDAIDSLGYVPDNAARSLRTRKTLTIAGVIPDITNPFYPAFERGVQDVAERHGYSLITCNTDGVESKELKCLRLARQGQVDGVVGVFFRLTARHLRPLLERGVPFVRVEPAPQPVGPLPLDNLYVDNVAAAYQAVSYLIAHGHRRVAMLAGQSGPQASRIQGYRRALLDHALPIDDALIQGQGFQADDGYRAMAELLKQPSTPTALFAANDLIAMGAMAALRDAGLHVPDDVSIVGMDDIPAARLVTPPLTTISLFPEQLGRRAADMLFERLEGTVSGRGRCESMPFDLMIRGSTSTRFRRPVHLAHHAQPT